MNVGSAPEFIADHSGRHSSMRVTIYENEGTQAWAFVIRLERNFLVETDLDFSYVIQSKTFS